MPQNIMLLRNQDPIRAVSGHASCLCTPSPAPYGGIGLPGHRNSGKQANPSSQGQNTGPWWSGLGWVMWQSTQWLGPWLLMNGQRVLANVPLLIKCWNRVLAIHCMSLERTSMWLVKRNTGTFKLMPILKRLEQQKSTYIRNVALWKSCGKAIPDSWAGLQ